NGPKRIQDPNYKGNAKTGHEYTRESILNPNAYIVPTFPENLMPPDFGTKLSVLALDKLVDFISQTEDTGSEG
ncbi:MAG: cytochrome C, partial [Nitrospinaceae bacterium]